MSALSDNLLLGAPAAAAGGISRSLRFNSSDSAYLSRTPASAGNRKTWTWAGWVKRSSLSTGLDVNLFTGGVTNSDTGFMGVYIDNNHKLTVAGATTNFLVSNSVYRDVSAWYHIIAAFDATQGTNANKIKLYVNGDLLTNFAIDNRASISNQDYGINQAAAHAIGRSSLNGARYFDGYLADIYFIDGQALDPSSFTEVSATTGQLIPKAYTGSFGTNGFWLKFSDNSAATATTLGKDYSGNSNNWTPNNLSVTAGAGNDSLVDTPTSYGTGNSGGDVRGNFCTWNPLDKAGNATFSNGNLDAQTGASGYGTTRGTVGVSSGKWYWEVTFNSTDASNDLLVGILDTSASLAEYLGGNAKGYAYWAYNGQKVNTGAGNVNYGSSYAPGDIIGVALDLDAGNLVFYKNGTSQGTAYSSLSGTFSPAFSDSGGSNISLTANFGQRAFAYTAPSGFKALVDTNLPSPLTAKSASAFQAITYTGTGANATIPNVNTVPTSIDFTPDLVWIKGRSGATDHALYDSVRDVQKDLVSNSTAAETTQSTGLTAFGTNTFNIGTLAKLNTSSSTYVAWCWDAGSSTVTNTQGSITSSVRANASAGFSIVSWSANNTANQSIGHGLGVTPAFIIHKNRTTAGNWNCWFTGFSNDEYINLNGTGAKASTGGGLWYQTPTSSLFYIGFTGSAINNSTDAIISYCFAPVSGYSSFGSYVGNGTSGDGVFVYTGFRVRWLLIKQSSAAGEQWFLLDSARSPYNIAQEYLCPSASFGETSAYNIVDFLSNGFKLRATGSISSFNGSGATYIYAAFAESPFAYSRAR